MAVDLHKMSEDRAIIYFNCDELIDLDSFISALNSISAVYKRHSGNDPLRGEPAEPRLFISKISSGSIEAEIVPMIVLVGSVIPYIDAALVVKEFTGWVGGHLMKFAGLSFSDEDLAPAEVVRDDLEDLKQVLKPVAGKRGALLGVRHVRYEKSDGDRKVIAEYNFSEPEINKASVNIENQIENNVLLLDSKEDKQQKLWNEVLLVWHQASREEGKEKGRTGDKAIIEEITEKPLPVYFPQQVNDLKRIMTQDEPYIFSKGYIVDVQVDYSSGEPKIFRVLNLHDVVEIG